MGRSRNTRMNVRELRVLVALVVAITPRLTSAIICLVKDEDLEAILDINYVLGRLKLKHYVRQIPGQGGGTCDSWAATGVGFEAFMAEIRNPPPSKSESVNNSDNTSLRIEGLSLITGRIISIYLCA